MADTPRTIIVRLDVRGADEDFFRSLRRLVRARPPLPPRRGLRARLARWLHGRH